MAFSVALAAGWGLTMMHSRVPAYRLLDQFRLLHTPTCRGPAALSVNSAACQHCSLTPQHAGHFLGCTDVDVDITVLLGAVVVATGTTLFDATPDILTPDLGNVPLSLTANAPVSGVGTQTVTVKVTFTPRDTIDADPLLVERAEQYQTCFPSPPPPPPSVFDAATFSAFYGTVFWAPGVVPAVPAAGAFMQHTMAYCNCPEAGTLPTVTLEDGTTQVPSIPDVAATVVGCYPANPALETCRKLRRCTPLEYESNAGSRAKHEDVECETLAVCPPTDEFEVVAATATTDRVCATKIERCSVDAGEVAVSGPEPMPACVPVEPCAATEYQLWARRQKASPCACSTASATGMPNTRRCQRRGSATGCARQFRPVRPGRCNAPPNNAGRGGRARAGRPLRIGVAHCVVGPRVRPHVRVRGNRDAFSARVGVDGPAVRHGGPAAGSRSGAARAAARGHAGAYLGHHHDGGFGRLGGGGQPARDGHLGVFTWAVRPLYTR